MKQRNTMWRCLPQRVVTFLVHKYYYSLWRFSYIIVTFVTPVKSCSTCMHSYRFSQRNSAFASGCANKAKMSRFVAVYKLLLLIVLHIAVFLFYLLFFFVLHSAHKQQNSCVLCQIYKFIWLHLLSLISNKMLLKYKYKIY